jgi:hypothetical protein
MNAAMTTFVTHALALMTVRAGLLGIRLVSSDPGKQIFFGLGLVHLCHQCNKLKKKLGQGVLSLSTCVERRIFVVVVGALKEKIFSSCLSLFAILRFHIH